MPYGQGSRFRDRLRVPIKADPHDLIRVIPAKGDRPALNLMSQLPEREVVMSKVKLLATVSTDLEKNSRMLAAANNMVMAEQLRRQVDELNKKQDRLVREIAGWHPDEATRESFLALTRKVDDFKVRIKAVKTHDELKELQAEMDSSVDQWVHQFQTIVAQLVGAPPPPSPVYQQEK